MAKYRKKPIVIEATQYLGQHIDGICQCDPRQGEDYRHIHYLYMTPHIHTLEGPLNVSYGDYIITGIKGEQYPCKHDIFLATYEPVEE